MIFHRRNRLAVRRGSQWYRDKAIRTTSTVCGAPVTEFDCAWNDKMVAWKRDERDGGEVMTPCAACHPQQQEPTR